MTLNAAHIDEFATPRRRPAVESFELAWTDATLHDPAVAVTRLADLERTRRFAHRGAAITWGRRKLFHGQVFGGVVEMRRITSYEDARGEIAETHDEPVEITLDGFRKTHTQRQFHGPWKVTLEKPVKKHREDDECW